ncbi:MAG TPA: PIN domain-containing protein [Candidatus Saccharimonadia bacterium]|nr:PIN domain-containing protein [Candidatus Saccharimonadia bacterium]
MTGRLALDTNVLLYALTRGSAFYEPAAAILRGQTDCDLMASELVVAELLSHDSVGSKAEYEKVDGLIRSQVFEVVPVSAEVLYLAAGLRREHRLTLADAIHVAAAVVGKATHFVTNDRDLRRCTVAGLEFLDLETVGRLMAR